MARFACAPIWPGGDWLVHYLLSFGAQLSVLDPPELRTALAQAAAQVLIANR